MRQIDTKEAQLVQGGAEANVTAVDTTPYPVPAPDAGFTDPASVPPALPQKQVET